MAEMINEVEGELCADCHSQWRPRALGAEATIDELKASAIKTEVKLHQLQRERRELAQVVRDRFPNENPGRDAFDIAIEKLREYPR